MVYIYLLMILLNSSITYSLYFKKNVEETLFFSIILKIIALFISGVLFNLSVGYYFILIINLIYLFYNIYKIKNNFIEARERIITPGLLLILMSYLLFIFLSHGRLATIWDEFSHWALVVKNMYYFNTFGLEPYTTVAIKDYLSGTSLFQYFFVKLSGSFNESIMYLAMNMTTISFVLPAFKKIKSIKNWYIYLIYITALFIPTIFCFNIYNSLYVDAILGMAFAYSLYSYFLDDGTNNKFMIINFALSLMMLVFIKDFGFVLAIIVFGIVLFDSIFIKNKFKWNFKYLIKNNWHIILSFFTTLVVKLIWMIEISKYITEKSVSKSIIISLKSLLTANFNDYRIQVIISFINEMFFGNFFGSNRFISFMSYVNFIIIFFGFSYIFVHNLKDKIDKRRKTSMITFLMLGAFAYAFLILIAYITVFSEYEAVRLASFYRYLGTYLLGMLLLLFILLLDKYSEDILKIKKFAVVTFLLIFLSIDFTSLLNITVFARGTAKKSVETRAPYAKSAKYIIKNVKTNDKIYFISIADKGYNFWAMRYEITPLKSNIDNRGWSLGKSSYYEGDIWTLPVSKEEWKNNLIENYDYVYLFEVNEEFIKQYGSLFDNDVSKIINKQLYKINKDKTANKILELVSN